MDPNNRPPRPSMDGFSRMPQNPARHLKPDYRPDHELPAPKPEPLLPKPEQLSPIPPLSPKKSRRGLRKWIIAGISAFALVLLAAFGMAYSWYLSQLGPATSDTTKHVRVTIKPGTTPSEIASQLQSAHVIRNSLAFMIYTKLSGAESRLKAGTYSLQPSLSTTAIVEHLVSGKVDTFDMTFLPGDTLANDRQKLINIGYSAQEVDAALAKIYNRPLFASKPDGTDLEGYLYGETINVDSSSSVEAILGRFFDLYEAALIDNNLVAGFQKQGLTLYQGITLASIVQREMSNHVNDMPQVARVFLNRLQAGMTLGSDVTYQYAAKKLGVAPSPTLNSPYNTRINPGLPPGPIATPGLHALMAVAYPANNNYLYFLSGDDGVTYFATTDAQHQQNIAQYCQKKCQIQ